MTSAEIIFGSHARGEADEGSDYDILVIEPEVANAARESVRLRTELGDLLVPIDVVVIDRERCRPRASVRGTMVGRALREGRVLATREELEQVSGRVRRGNRADPWAVATRYNDINGTLDRSAAVVIGEKCLTWARERVDATRGEQTVG